MCRRDHCAPLRALLLLALTAACGSELEEGARVHEADGGALATPVSFDDDVQPVLDRHCVQCHTGELGQAGVRLEAGEAYATLTTRESSFCGLPLVAPGAPEQSALWIKLSEDISDLDREDVMRCGREMPALGGGSLLFVDAEAAEVVRLWIAQGALP